MNNLVLTVFAFCLLIAPGLVHAAETAPNGLPTEAQMQKAMTLGKPGAPHKILASLVGKWDYTTTFKMAPDAPAQISTGTGENTWVLDDRQLQQSASGMMDMNGRSMKYEGIGYLGHDNVKGEYVSIWMDNMSTGLMYSSGQYDAATKTIKQSGDFYCPIENGKITFNSELTITDKDNYMFTTYQTTNGQRFKSMEIKFKRKQ